ncbi:protein of unknown function DUF1555 [Isosphaera pallida ATCC 43644]|uniref:PEP-CTERM protein-sorting domain-containing protein n=1 Tax=Isosphaera pallida (strain ATCC 43644 / DSM 9630 / IS1B) TaxID=575540 RepID=E8R1X1_ISOPI|nr:PEP-CTERM sorting domain-containing protein [Isosphaera pallida]ADV61393.1 protein of unknown function DUF1555 [Isosphaera pallida ATCC 43644]
MIQRLFVVFSAVAVMLCSSSVAWAAPIPITNPSFESPVVGTDGNFGGVPTGWAAGPGTQRVYDFFAADFSSGVFGNQVLALGNTPNPSSILSQNTSVTVAPGIGYQMTVYVGRIAGQAPYVGGQLDLEILGGSATMGTAQTVTHTFLNSLTPGQLVPITFTRGFLPTTDPLIGTSVGIRFTSTLVQSVTTDPFSIQYGIVYLDNVALDTILPEPGTWALMAVASVFGTGYLVKRRRRSLAA